MIGVKGVVKSKQRCQAELKYGVNGGPICLLQSMRRVLPLLYDQVSL